MDTIIPQSATQVQFDFDQLALMPVPESVLQVVADQGPKPKYCPGCKQTYPATTEYWHLCKTRKDGFNSRCKECVHNAHIARHPHPCMRCKTRTATRDRLCDECRQWKQDNNVEHCATCDQWLSVDYFDKHGTSKSGFRSFCKSCRHDEYAANSEEILQKQYDAYHSQTPEERREFLDRQNEYRNDRSMREREAGKCSKCLARPAEIGRLCKPCHDYQERYADKLRDEVFSVYGNSCAVCGESHPAFLAIDHIDNNGADHRRETGNGHRFYQWLRNNGFPDGYQVLCHNHNWLKHLDQKSGEKTSMQIWHANLRKETFDAYGGRCACCGEDQLEVLTIDHVNNDGAEHRKITGAGSRFYAWLRKEGFPQDGRFQILCFNCNIAKKIYGTCPHQC